MTTTDQTIDTAPDTALTAELQRRQDERQAQTAAELERLRTAQDTYDDAMLAQAGDLKAAAEEEFNEHYRAMEAAAQAGDVAGAYREAHAVMAARAYRSQVLNAAESAATRRGVDCPIPTNDRPVDIDMREVLNTGMARGATLAGDDRFAETIGHYPLDLSDIADESEG